MEKKCCICGKEFIGFGNNAKPIKDGCCCDACNRHFVTTARMISNNHHIWSYDVCKKGQDFIKISGELRCKHFAKIDGWEGVNIYENYENNERLFLCIV